jgi:hypothetical protein
MELKKQDVSLEAYAVVISFPRDFHCAIRPITRNSTELKSLTSLPGTAQAAIERTLPGTAQAAIEQTLPGTAQAAIEQTLPGTAQSAIEQT